MTAADCTLRARQDWAFAQLKEWYLFPDTLPAALDPTPYVTVSDYIDALTATARAQHKDRFFTYLTSISQETAFNNAGASAGFGARLAIDAVAKRVIVSEAFEGAPALAAGIDRGTEILAIGTTVSNLQSVSNILTASGPQGISDAIGPTSANISRVLKVVTAGVTSTVTVTKANFSLDPVSPRFGAQIITDGGKQYGYVNLRTFINTADPQLRAAFANFRAAGIKSIIVDLRYNGGGLIAIADLMGDLMGANRLASDPFRFETFRPEKSARNSVHNFTAQPESIAPTRIAFIGTTGTASSSELVVSGMLPYLHTNVGLIGTNTLGKPVGQIADDQAACDDRFRIIAFSLDNADHRGGYFNGLSSFVEASCQAGDDFGFPMGDPREASTRSALDFLEGKACIPVTANSGISTLSFKNKAELLMPQRPTAAQLQTPGLF